MTRRAKDATCMAEGCHKPVPTLNSRFCVGCRLDRMKAHAERNAATRHRLNKQAAYNPTMSTGTHRARSIPKPKASWWAEPMTRTQFTETRQQQAERMAVTDPMGRVNWMQPKSET